MRVRAAAVNPKDTFIRKGYIKSFTGSRFPMPMGFDFSGEVVKTGNLVRTFHEGEHVYGMLKGWRGGTYAEFIAIKPEQLATIPGSLSHPPVLVLLALTLRDIDLYPLLKWALVSPP